MVAFFDLDLKQIARLGRDYPWPQPSSCPQCGRPKPWGHGFVTMFFSHFAHALLFRRYRCPACGGVIRLRPTGHLPRHQSEMATIRNTLSFRLQHGRWPPGTVTNRARHWLAALKRNAFAAFGLSGRSDPMDAFDRLLALGRVPVSRAV